MLWGEGKESTRGRKGGKGREGRKRKGGRKHPQYLWSSVSSLRLTDCSSYYIWRNCHTVELTVVSCVKCVQVMKISRTVRRYARMPGADPDGTSVCLVQVRFTYCMSCTGIIYWICVSYRWDSLSLYQYWARSLWDARLGLETYYRCIDGMLIDWLNILMLIGNDHSWISHWGSHHSLVT